MASTRNPSRWWAIIIGSGVALSPIHNQRLTELTTSANGETLFFLPPFGYLLLIMGAGLFLLHNWNKVKEVGWGDQRIVGCLLFIVMAVAASGSAYTDLQERFAPLGMGLVLIALYLCGRILGKDAFLPLAVGAVIASLGVVAYQIIYPGTVTGGFVFERNYDIVVGYVLLGAALFIHRHQWLFAGLALIAILLTGSPEGLFAIGVLSVTILIRKDWSRRLVIIIVPVIIVGVVGLTTGCGQSLYGYAERILNGETTSANSDGGPPRNALEYRMKIIYGSLSNIKLLGEGYNLTDFGRSPNVHNVPLILVQQLGYPGILAAIAWLYITIWCLIKTKWKYVWILVIALSVFDHFIWTQLAPLYPLIVGASMTSDIKSDLVFRSAS